MGTTTKISVKNYREQLKYAKAIIKGIDVLVEGSDEFQDLDKAVIAAQSLEVVAQNLQYFIKNLKEVTDHD
jgi:hypothetical protein